MKKGAHNGHVPFVELYEALFNDLMEMFPLMKADLNRDLLLIVRRVREEGLSFLTKTLPRFGKAFDKVLSTGGHFVSTDFHKAGKTGLPAFLRGFLGKVFSSDGRVKPDASVECISAVRQISYLLYKLEIPYDEALLDSKVEAFKALDEGLDFDMSNMSDQALRAFVRAKAAITTLMKDFDLSRVKHPKHGPGSVAGREKPWEKTDFKYVEQINSCFPYCDWFYLNYQHFADECNLNEPEFEYLCSRLEFVPKDSRGPRLIAMEPKEYMWVQQAIKEPLYDHVESHPLTKGHVNFTDQTINRTLALHASLHQDLVTLDMKDASDSVSLRLVEELFKDSSILPLLLSSRTPCVELPSGEVLIYRKFAPMGSALCFPVEALVFWALAVGCVVETHGVPSLVAMENIYVYGDDIIVPKEWFESLLKLFPEYCLKFNFEKCCFAGSFRESCGCDAYNGEDVTPIKVKHASRLLMKKPGKHLRVIKDPVQLVSWVEYSNAFHLRGFFSVAAFFRKQAEWLLGPLPVLGGLPTALILRGFSNCSWIPGLPVRWNKDYQRHEVRTWTVSPVRKTVDANTWSELFLSVLSGPRERDPGVYDLPRRIKLRKTWIAF